jgi:DNA-binding FrmR family transcriptional regulator
VAGYAEHKEDVLRSLRRIEVQVRDVQRMVVDDVDGVEVLTRVSEVGAALHSCAATLLDDHIGSCVAEAVAEGGDAARAKVGEAALAIARLIRT